MWSPSIPPADLHQCGALYYALMCGWCMLVLAVPVYLWIDRVIYLRGLRRRR